MGAGAVGLAFADTLLAETKDARLTIVDRHGLPGGHWNDAYAFVALHQPSAFYGVNSMPLGSGTKDTHGANAGLYELASGAEVSSYFDAVMRRRLLPSGRVRYLPMTEHLGGGRLRSLLTGEESNVEVAAKLVDATYYGTSVPATHRPKFEVEPGVRLVTPNALPHLARAPDGPPGRFVVLGAGKTAMDVVVWLVGAGVPADRISWVVPRDSWLLNRVKVQPGVEFFHETIGGEAAHLEALAAATSADDLFDRLEAAGVMVRIDRQVRPTMFHYATISLAEVETLRTVSDVIRMGRVRRVEKGRLVLEGGETTLPADALFIDCTASAVEKRPSVPIFQPDRIVCQIVRAPQTAFSAALVAYVEATYPDDATKNALCATVPFPDGPEDYARTMLASLSNHGAWRQDAKLRSWIKSSRLDAYGETVAAVRPDDLEKLAVLGRIREAAGPAVGNLRRLAG